MRNGPGHPNARWRAQLVGHSEGHGLRLEELAELEWPDVRDSFMTVWKGKGRKQRLVPLLPAAVEALR